MPIAIRKGDVNIGEDVYAIGSPMGHKFNTTLTKGIMSGFRDTNGNKFLQSDVTILPGNSGGPLLDSNGNAIGITVSGMVVKGFSGMNFFIPIEDALAKLGVEIE
jgi:S1-C subfamily serine protease